jgi:hypothetical protein
VATSAAVLAPENLSASASVISAPINLVATAQAATPENLAASTPVNTPISLVAQAESVLVPDNLIAIADAATPISLTAEPLPVLTPENLLANPVHAEKPINLQALGAVIEPQNLVAGGGFIESPQNLVAAAPAVFADYRSDTNANPTPMYMLSTLYAAGIASVNWQYFLDNTNGSAATAAPPTTSQELSNSPWAGAFSSRAADPLTVFWPTANTANTDYIGPVKFRDLSGAGDQYVYWMKMNWGGLRDWGDMGANGLNSTLQWAQTRTGTSPSWYVQFKSSTSNADTFTWWLVADTTGQYRFRLLTSADVGTSYQSGISGLPISGHSAWNMFESLAFSDTSAFERHEMTYLNNTPLRIWATPTPVTPTNPSDVISFVDSSGVTQTDSFRTLDTT